MIRKGISKLSLIIAIIIVVVIIIGAVYMLLPKKEAVKEIKIGVLQPLSGKLAETGADNKRGFEFMVNKINENGGIKSLGGAKIKLVWGDTAGDPSTGAAEAERLITEEHVVALMGAYQSSVTKTASEVAERYGVPFINGDSSSPTLTERGYKWYFRTFSHDGMFAKQHVDFVKWLNQKYNAGIKKVAIIHEDTEWGTGCKNMWTKYFTEEGFEVVKVVSYHAATVTSLDAEVASLKAVNPDIVLAACYVSDAVLFMSTVKKLDFNPKAILAMDAGFMVPSYIQQIGNTGFFVFSRAGFNWDLVKISPKLQQYNEEYKKKYGIDISENSAKEIVAVITLYHALEEAGKHADPSDLNTFRQALREALENMNLSADDVIPPWRGVKFDAKHQNILGGGLVVQMMDDGKYHTVYPEEIATTEPVFPMPKWSERG